MRGMDVFGVVVNIVLIVLTAVVVYFAWRTVREGRDAGQALKETVASLKDLLAATKESATLVAQSADAAKQTVTSLTDLIAATNQAAQHMADSSAAAQETVTIAKATREQAEYDRKLRALMDVEELAERIFWQAAAASGHESMTGWRIADQNYLGQALARVEISLPASRRLVGGLGTAEAVMGAARDAQREAEFAIRLLREQRPEE
jgi:hypothetical protein